MANVWREPIFDRTLEDVEFAIQKIDAWKKNHTHTVDIQVDNDELLLQNNGTAYVEDEKLILHNEGAIYVEDGVVTLDIDDVYDLKGCFNLTDLNRIEEDIAYLADKMESYFFHPNIHHKRWTKGDLPNANDLSRIMDNIRSITGNFYSPTNAPSLPATMLSYSDINAIEENLHLIKELLDCLESSLKKTGAIKSGSTTFLPIRR